MANNRMYLIHRPTGKGVYLGKRLATEWYDAHPKRIPLGKRVQELFDTVGISDEFFIGMQDANESDGLAYEVRPPFHGPEDKIIHFDPWESEILQALDTKE